MRHITIDPSAASSAIAGGGGTAEESNRGNGEKVPKGRNKNEDKSFGLALRVIKEEYALDKSRPAEEQYRRIEFNLVERCYRIDFQFGANRITASTREFSKDTTKPVSGWNADPLQGVPKETSLAKELDSLKFREIRLISELRDRERDFVALLDKQKSYAMESKIEPR